ncbi:formin-binding protein 4-like isoform X2 [Saccostrea echinata]|nr:formin-binding protein 4-like isoform X2 [Saccostrea echinata]
MGRTRGGRRHVLQLNDNQESYLAKYGYSRPDEDDEENNSGSDMETEQDNGGAPEASSSVRKPPDTPDIDDKVADFLAEIQSIEPEAEEDPDARPSFQNGGGMAIPPPTFALNASKSLAEEVLEPETPVPKKSKNAYKSMFVKGESEFVRPKEKKEAVKTVTEETEWPEEPTTVWQQTLDENTSFHYYWNTVTNEVTWEIPPDYTRYLLQYKDYEEKVAKLQKEGKVKPPAKTAAKEPEGPALPAPKTLVTESLSTGATTTALTESQTNNTTGESVSSSSEVIPETAEAQSGILKNKQDSTASILPDSTNSKSKTLQLVAYHGGSSAESSTDSSEDSDSDEDTKKSSKRSKDQDADDLDIDDIDKALELALEKKKSHKEHKSRRRSSEAKADKEKSNLPKTRSLVDAMREQVQQKQEVEARRKAAIEEMMARELERRVGPPRKRPTPEDPSLHGDWEGKRTKVMEYEHGRRSRRDERDSQGRSSTDKDYDRDTRHKRDDHKKHKKDDRDRDRKRDEKKRDEHRKKDKNDDRRRDEKKRHKDKDRDREKDEKKKDKKKDKQRDEEKEEKTENEKKPKESTKKAGSEERPEEKAEIKKEAEDSVKKEVVSPPPPPIIKKSEPPPPVVKKEGANFGESHLTAVQLANLKMQASELVELALSKLEFLEVTKKGLSKLQILLVELETRQQDWQSGGLSTEYFLIKLEEANRQLQQYEQSAAPPGWSCHWDRAYRRYFYMNKKTSRTQWDYPDEEEEEEEEPDDGADKGRQHSSSYSPPRDLDEDTSRASDMGYRNEEVASSSTIDSEIKSKTPGYQKSENSHGTENFLDSTNDNKPLGDNSDSMDIEDQSMESAEISQGNDGEPVSSTIQPTSEAGLPDTTSITSVMDEIFMGKSKYGHPTPVSSIGVAQVSESYNYTSSVAAASVMQGEPPPPGTDLDLLLTAPPPPPPPPAEEACDVPMEAYDASISMAVSSHSLPYSSIDCNPMVHSSVASSMYSSDVGMIPVESSYTSERSDAQPVSVSQEPVVIARPPQVFSREEPGPSEVVSGTEPVQESVSGDVTSAQLELPSSSGISSEKKKKKKDKSMSGSGLHLKKKNVSTLVQKWQKVKKEVEIEERHREEREQAIRQKLEEWKQEYS